MCVDICMYVCIPKSLTKASTLNPKEKMTSAEIKYKRSLAEFAAEKQK